MIETKTLPGTLYIVPTPIGNLEDITLRALRVLKEVDVIGAEDTRHSRKLLTHYGIGTPLISYYREKEAARGEVLIEKLLAGQNVALVTDAGTPCISDPGAVVVGMAHQRGIKVVPLPGASAILTALSGSGIDLTGFLFLGFLPAKSQQRKSALAGLVASLYPVVIYESPHRIADFLSDALEILGDRQAFIARELTKTFEELQRTTLRGLLSRYGDGRAKGEFVVIICPGAKEEVTGQTLDELLIWYRDHSELSLKDVSKRLATDLGLPRTAIYQKALTLWQEKQ